MVRHSPFLVVLGALASACTATLPEGVGRGLLAFDPTPPPGVETHERPELRAGDRYAFLRGGELRQDYTIQSVDEEGVAVAAGDGHVLRRTKDLGYLGQWDENGRAVQRFAPFDARFHWPLWVGKRWKCDYVLLQLGEDARRIEVDYHVEEADRITVPGGTFDTLRIVRTERLRVDGETYLDRTAVNWYAPAVGLEVRQLIGGTEFELIEWTRGPGK
ncbi:MAG: hypothetical protein NXI31_18430 [bacterium]|nr:hypothetical protein [bacterium]